MVQAVSETKSPCSSPPPVTHCLRPTFGHIRAPPKLHGRPETSHTPSTCSRQRTAEHASACCFPLPSLSRAPSRTLCFGLRCVARTGVSKLPNNTCHQRDKFDE